MDIIEFISNGAFKKIPFKIDRKALLKIMGETDCTAKSFRKAKRPSIYKYGKVEFYFDESEAGKLIGIMVQPNIHPCNEGKLGFEYAWIKAHMSMDKVIEGLNNNGCNYDIHQEELVIRLHNGVEFFFYEADSSMLKNAELNKIGKFIK